MKDANKSMPLLLLQTKEEVKKSIDKSDLQKSTIRLYIKVK